MENSRTSGTNMICACSRLLKEAKFVSHLIYFDYNVDYQCSHLCPKGHNFFPQSIRTFRIRDEGGDPPFPDNF